MIEIGKYQTLTVAREKEHGIYLEDEEGEDVLLPKRYVTSEMSVGSEVKVFIYCDSEDWEIATTDIPKFEVNQFAVLEVKDVTSIGAFCDWGMPKDLLVPFRNQAQKLKKGDKTIVYMYLDELSERLVGSTKLNSFLENEADEDLKAGQKVNIIAAKETELGRKVIINHTYSGLIYHNEINQKVNYGDSFIGYIKPLRPDGKIDVSLDAVGIEHRDASCEAILNNLKNANGFLPFTDKSDPDLIRNEFGMSKKLFKKSIGGLYKERLIRIEKDGIFLIED